jgi:hypothetical protein
MIVFFVISFAACTGTETTPACPQGSEGCPCYPSDTCDGDLSCRSGLCLDLSDGDAETVPDGDLEHDGLAPDGDRDRSDGDPEYTPDGDTEPEAEPTCMETGCDTAHGWYCDDWDGECRKMEACIPCVMPEDCPNNYDCKGDVHSEHVKICIYNQPGCPDGYERAEDGYCRPSIDCYYGDVVMPGKPCEPDPEHPAYKPCMEGFGCYQSFTSGKICTIGCSEHDNPCGGLYFSSGCCANKNPHTEPTMICDNKEVCASAKNKSARYTPTRK